MTINTDGTRFGPKSGRSKKQSAISIKPQPGHACFMLTEIYIEPLLVDAELADQVWEAWDRWEIDDAIACNAWMLISFKISDQSLEAW